MRIISNMPNLVFIDISFAKQVTDAGLVHFSDKQLALHTISVSGCTSISSAGLTALLNCCTATLVDLEAQWLDQENFKSDFFVKLGYCWQLEYLDLAGCTKLDDSAAQNIAKAEIESGDAEVKVKHQPGLRMLHTFKMGCVPFTDFALGSILKVTPNVQHLEVSGCEQLTEYGLKQIIEKLPRLKYLDMSRIPIVNYAFLDELKNTRPELLTKRY